MASAFSMASSSLHKHGAEAEISQCDTAGSTHLVNMARTNETLKDDSSAQKTRRDSSSTASPERVTSADGLTGASPVQYKVYKRRFFGLVQLVLLNIVISWSWITFAPVSATAAEYFNTSESTINWLSTAFLFAFVVATPATIYAIHHHGPKTSITIAASLLLAGSWIKYGGAKANNFGVVMFGQLLIGLAQPFSLTLPTTYSQVWFSAAGRTSATAVTSLSNPLGAALGQLVSPYWATSPSKIPDSVLYTSIIASVACLPAFLIPARPPTPPTAASDADAVAIPPLGAQLRKLFGSFEFYLIFLPFSAYVGLFNAYSSLLNQFLAPYGFSEDDAGIAGALLIFVGIGASAISSPLIDKYKFYLVFIKICIPIIAVMYLAFIWAPPSKSIAYAYVVSAILGASSFGLVPVVLEYLVEIHYPLGPELGSTLSWAGGQLLGGIFIIVMDALKSKTGNPPGNMHRALIFQAVVALAFMPLPILLGLFGRGEHVRRRRWEMEKGRWSDNASDSERQEHMSSPSV